MHIGKVEPREISQEMREAYLDYAMSVIVSRALPDVRDGLKPVHRRILYTMHEMGLRHNVKFRKSAAVVGETLAKYHPHGDAAVYDSMARMAQDFSLRYPLVEGQGNWGCFTKDTKVKLTDGRSPSFGELIKEYAGGKRNFTYTFNRETKRIEMAEISAPRLTRKDAKLVRVILDNGAKIKCTPNHRFMLRDGSYKEAQYLKRGDSLMPCYFRLSIKKENPNIAGYTMVLQPQGQKWEWSHHLADAWNIKNGVYEKSRGRIRHHLDFNKLNNNPDNIQRLTWQEHWKLHYEYMSWKHKNDPEYVAKLAWGRREYIESHHDEISARISKLNKVLWKSSSFRKKWIESVKAMWRNPEYKKRMSSISSKNLKSLWKKKEFKELLGRVKSKELKERWKNKEYAEKMREVTREMSNKLWKNSEHREKMARISKERWLNPKYRAKQSNIAKELWQDPLYRAKYSKDHFSKMAKILWGDPSLREFHRNKARQQWRDAAFRKRCIETISMTSKRRVVENPNLMKELAAKAAASLKEKWLAPEYKSRVIKSRILGYVAKLLARQKSVTPDVYDSNRHNNCIPRSSKAAMYFGGFEEMIAEARRYNHKVISVEFLKEQRDVYDFTINGTHNFLLDAGVFVHNSVDGDAPAAMRYTEARMSRIADEILKDSEKNTVEWVDNYDATHKEPKVLPSAVPQLLMNGAMGIAVGMATNIPPHNITELMDALAYLIDTPDATVPQLLKFVKGPDFPTGGIVFGKKNMVEAYAQGKGPIVTRGVVEIKEASNSARGRGAGDSMIEITEIPYQVNKSALIEKMAELVKEGRIEGIKDLRDESDREGMSIVIELKKDAHPQKIVNALYKFTELQKTFHLNMLALVDGIQPQVLSIRDALEKYLEHRKIVVRRRLEFDLERAKERAHILEGLKKALDQIDEVIRTIKASKDRNDAHKNLQEKFKFSEVQATAILEMRLQALANLERQKVEDELKEKKRIIKEITLLLSDKKAFLEFLKEEFRVIKETYQDERKTKIVAAGAEELAEEDLIPKEETIISLTRGGYIKRVSPSAYKAQKRGGKGIIGMETKGEDVVEHVVACSTHDRLLFFTAQGRVYQTLAYEIPKSTRIGRGKAIANFLELEKNDFVTAILSLPRLARDGEEAEKGGKPKFLIMATKHGLIKKTTIEDFQNVRRSGLGAIHLKEGDMLKWVGVTRGKDEIMLTTALGQAIRFREADVRPMGRTAAGVRAIHLKGDDEVISMVVLNHAQKYILLVSENGFGKRTSASLFKTQKRGGSGIKAIKVTPKTGKLMQSIDTEESEDELIAVSQKGQVIRTALKNISILGRATQGVKIMRLDSGDKIASAVTV